MPSTYSTSLRIELQADGENASTWGQKANNDFNLFEASIAGRVAAPVGGAVDVTLTTVNGAADQARNAIIELTGVLTGNINVIVPTVTKQTLFYNNTTGSFSLTVKTAAGTGIVVAQGSKRWLYCDGTNVVDALSSYITGLPTATITDTTAGAAGVVAMRLLRNKGAGVAADILDAIAFGGESSTTVQRDYGSVDAQITSPTNGAEAGRVRINSMQAGALAVRSYFGLGHYSASNTDQGADTLNYTTLYEAGVSLAAKYAKIGKRTVDLLGGGWLKNSTTPPSGTNQYESATNKVNRQTLDFASGSKTIATFNIPMPKSWNGGTVTFRTYFENTVGSNNVVFGMQIVALRSGDTIDTAFGTAVETTTAVGSATQMIIAAESTAVTPGGTVGSQCMLNIQFYRKGTGADTNTGVARVWAVQFFYTTNAGDDT